MPHSASCDITITITIQADKPNLGEMASSKYTSEDAKTTAVKERNGVALCQAGEHKLTASVEKMLMSWRIGTPSGNTPREQQERSGEVVGGRGGDEEWCKVG